MKSMMLPVDVEGWTPNVDPLVMLAYGGGGELAAPALLQLAVRAGRGSPTWNTSRRPALPATDVAWSDVVAVRQ